jgi:hypothetical protein
MLTGVLLSAEPGPAAGGHRLLPPGLYGIWWERRLAEGQKVLVPARALGELQRLLATLGAAPEGERQVSLCGATWMPASRWDQCS